MTTGRLHKSLKPQSNGTLKDFENVLTEYCRKYSYTQKDIDAGQVVVSFSEEMPLDQRILFGVRTHSLTNPNIVSKPDGLNHKKVENKPVEVIKKTSSQNKSVWLNRKQEKGAIRVIDEGPKFSPTLCF